MLELNRQQASVKLGISIATLKRHMMIHGISKWPYRQLVSIEAKCHRLEESLKLEQVSEKRILLLRKIALCKQDLKLTMEMATDTEEKEAGMRRTQSEPNMTHRIEDDEVPQLLPSIHEALGTPRPRYYDDEMSPIPPLANGSMLRRHSSDTRGSRTAPAFE